MKPATRIYRNIQDSEQFVLALPSNSGTYTSTPFSCYRDPYTTWGEWAFRVSEDGRPSKIGCLIQDPRTEPELQEPAPLSDGLVFLEFLGSGSCLAGSKEKLLRSDWFLVIGWWRELGDEHIDTMVMRCYAFRRGRE